MTARARNIANATTATRLEAWEIRVRGTVQGVGFRPHVWRLARRFGLRGSVANDADGVIIRVRGEMAALQAFRQALQTEAPPLARIAEVRHCSLPVEQVPEADFHIDTTQAGPMRTQVPADAAPCADCLAELNDPANRRHRYPFTNCTHCGPRLTIIEAMPYDRPNTSMARFRMCPACQAEYDDPADRRFHAQPNACPECGPQVWLCDAEGAELARGDAAVHEVVQLLRAGRIMAVRGVGGYHLMVDATNAEAVAMLRRRKHRPAKPLALLARDVAVIRRYRQVSAAEEEVLHAREAPIVLLERPGAEHLPEEIAPGLDVLGFMLPMSPLHQLLAQAFDTPLVCTSANRSGQPQCTANEQALADLADIADAFLMHDRDIVNRVDDSVIRFIDGAPVPLRRSRGYAPAPLPLPEGFDDHPAVLALGGELKNTFCLLKDGEAILSHHIGDLEEARTWADWQQALARYEELFAFAPNALAVDMHPAYRSTAFGEERAMAEGLPLIQVQHHHAHLAAVMADNRLPADHGPVIGVILDGIGHGEDGTGWGAEILLGDYAGYTRVASLAPAALVGGEAAMREPWRNLAARLLADDGLRRQMHDLAARLPSLRKLREKPLPTIAAMMEKGVNAPLASSAGRLFDAVAALLGVAPDRQSFEGEAAMRLEALAWRGRRDAASSARLVLAWQGMCADDGRTQWLNPAPMLAAMMQALADGGDAAVLAHAFHDALVQAFADAAARVAQEHGCETVALSGGVLQNRLLAELLSQHLHSAGLAVLVHRQVPPNDGGLSLGQACIAARRLMQDGQM